MSTADETHRGTLSLKKEILRLRKANEEWRTFALILNEDKERLRDRVLDCAVLEEEVRTGRAIYADTRRYDRASFLLFSGICLGVGIFVGRISRG